MIYICIPTHNEQQTVGVVLWKLRQVLTEFRRDYQLLVADDASSDKTADVLEPYTRVLPLTVIRSDARQGSAASMEMLLREAIRRSEYPKRDVIVTLQADFSEEPDDLVPLVKRLEAGADVAVGNKVSTSKETRARRFARSLARFFMRRQKWPEGVMTPFDGYRAYRLYAVKRAIEERGPRRLIRHDGWAGHAELLQAVLPHARRVDVIDVDDRPDRLQRPRREKPFAAAMQVRVMASGAEPQGLVGVDELDRVALTASRSRERAAVTAQSIHAERGAGSRGNGSRARQNGQRRDQNRSRSQSNGAGRSVTGAAEARPRRERPQQAGGRPPGGRTRRKTGDGGSSQPRPEKAAAAAEETKIHAAEGAAMDAATQPKRKRRRRKRGAQGRTGGGAPEQNALPGVAGQEADGGEIRPAGSDAVGRDKTSRDAAGPDASSRDAAGPDASSRDAAGPDASSRDAASAEGAGPDAVETAAGEDDETAAKKRRRRGGRRGGRGRRKPRSESATEAAAGAAEVGGGGTDRVGGSEGGPDSAGGGRAASTGGSEGRSDSAGGTDAGPAARDRPAAEPAARAENE